MTERYLAIVEKDIDTGLITIVQNYGICDQALYEERMELLVQSEHDWDNFLNRILAEVINHGILTTSGIEKGFTFGSVLSLIRSNVELVLKQPNQKKDLKITAALKALDMVLLVMDKGKEIDITMQDVLNLNEELAPILTRQLLRDPDRRNWIRPVLPITVLAYESQSLGSGN